MPARVSKDAGYKYQAGGEHEPSLWVQNYPAHATSEPSLNPLRMCWNRAKKIHLISEKLILAVAKERFERTISACGDACYVLTRHPS